MIRFPFAKRIFFLPELFLRRLRMQEYLFSKEPTEGQPSALLSETPMNPTAFIVICQDKNLASNIASFQRDVGIVAQTILLAATEDGLGGCMIGSFSLAELKKTLNLPENLEPVLVVALGKPAEKIVLTDVKEDGEIGYYRDENDVHYVPKRALKDILC